MLTIQRQFSLPNCVLILEGLNTDGTSSPRPLLSTLTRFECHFGDEAKRIQGGRELLNLLAERVHVQAQSLLSGIQSKAVLSETHALTLQPVEQGNYKLKIAESLLQPPEASDSDTKGDLELKLNSVQLFDLVEAFDQLMEDTQTLPDLALKLQPLSRKAAQSQGSAVQKFIPFSLGVASLALVTAISFVMPVPEVTKPKAPEGEANPEAIIESLPGDGTASDGEESNSENAPSDSAPSQ